MLSFLFPTTCQHHVLAFCSQFVAQLELMRSSGPPSLALANEQRHPTHTRTLDAVCLGQLRAVSQQRLANAIPRLALW